MGYAEVYELPQLSPNQWRAARNYDTWTESTRNEQLFVHWVGTPVGDDTNKGIASAEMSTLRGIEGYHLRNKYIGIAYDWMIGQSGTLYRGRGKARSAATSGDVDRDGTSNNVEGDGVCLLIGKGQTPSAKMLATLGAFVKAHGGDLYGHSEAKGTSTSCPGPDLLQWVKDVRNGEEPTWPSKDEEPAPTPDDGLLKIGDEGDEVRALQQELNDKGLADLVVDGDFGPKTEAAVKSAQETLGVTADGIVGPKTRAALDAYSKPEPKPEPEPEPPKDDGLLQKGDEGDAVKELQKLLNDKGLAKLAVDGDFGPNTEAAVKNAQEKIGVTADGIVGPKTRAALDNYNKPKPKKKRPTLKKGDKGEDVKVAQRLLDNLKVDGDFGTKTLRRVKWFQRQHDDLKVDGIIGPNTWAKLDA